MHPDFQTHHIGVLVKDIPSALIRYTESLGYEIRSQVFHDPVQTAYVQFLGLPGSTVHFELISPDGLESRLQNALKKGGGIHHICYSVSSIDEAVTTLQSQKWLVIHPPQPATAFNGRKIAWLMNRDHLLVELVERGGIGEL
jgi:methylmalonyl-CoA/ethylmalonyl-CoA epimerase